MSRALLLAGVLLGLGCERVNPQPYELQRAQFGVFFGGEVQELSQIALEPDRARQTIGIRLVFHKAPDPPLKVQWELAKPRKSAAPRRADAGPETDAAPPLAPAPADSLVEFGDVMTRPGDTVLDVPLTLRSGDPLGDWSVRATIQGQEVLNRPFRVIKPAPSRKSGNDY
jgi:hypothetical protein